jgi:hypothetical protein
VNVSAVIGADGDPDDVSVTEYLLLEQSKHTLNESWLIAIFYYFLHLQDFLPIFLHLAQTFAEDIFLPDIFLP